MCAVPHREVRNLFLSKYSYLQSLLLDPISLHCISSLAKTKKTQGMVPTSSKMTLVLDKIILSFYLY